LKHSEGNPIFQSPRKGCLYYRRIPLPTVGLR
jgi:hypothetical protein